MWTDAARQAALLARKAHAHIHNPANHPGNVHSHAGRMLGAKYKTWEGAHKRAGFERGVAGSEFRTGSKAKHYNYHVVQHEGHYRVVRTVNKELTAAGPNWGR